MWEIVIRNIGTSKGVVIPKPHLSQAGLEDQATANIVVENRFEQALYINPITH